jgi:hypothetical protein
LTADGSFWYSSKPPNQKVSRSLFVHSVDSANNPIHVQWGGSKSNNGTEEFINHIISKRKHRIQRTMGLPIPLHCKSVLATKTQNSDLARKQEPHSAQNGDNMRSLTK